MRKGLRKKRAICIGETSSTAQLLLEGGEREEVSKNGLGSPDGAGFGPENSLSTGWPLIVAAKAAERGTEPAGWDPTILLASAMALSKTLGEMRLLAVDALTAGATDVVMQLTLSEREKYWLLCTHHAALGHAGKALEYMVRLPRGAYPDKDRVVAACWSEVSKGAVDRDLIASHLVPFRERVLSNLLWQCLVADASDLESLQDGISALITVIGLPADSAARRRAEFLIACITDGIQFADDVSPYGPAWSLVAALAHTQGRGPIPSRIDVRAILRQSPGVRDDIFDAGLIGREDLEAAPREEAVGVLARIAPWDLTEEELKKSGLQEEVARRAFLARDRRQLEALSSVPAAHRFLLLDDLRAGKTEGFDAAGHGLEPWEIPTATALVEWLRTGGRDPVPPELLADRSTWETVAAFGSPVLVLEALGAERFGEWLQLHHAKSALFDWNWAGALEAARAALGVAREEAVRDEALNMIACAHWQLGNDEEAIRALEQALEGNYTEGLQANIGVIAEGLEPHTAAEHLGRLALEAPTLKLRVGAALRALALWTLSRERWEADGDADELPSNLRKALRELALQPIELDQFRRIARLLANWDAEWLEEPTNLVGSPHRESLEAEVYVSLAQGFQEFVKVLAPALRASDAAWLTEERDRLVDSALANLITESPSIGAALFGIDMLKAGVPLEAERRIPLAAFAVAAVAVNIDPSEGEPKEEFFDMLLAAKSDIGTVRAPERERVEEALGYGFFRLAVAFGASRAEQYNHAVNAYNQILSRLQGLYKWNVDRSAVRRATDPLLEFCDETGMLMAKLLPHVTETELREGLEQLRGDAHRLGAAIRSLPR